MTRVVVPSVFLEKSGFVYKSFMNKCNLKMPNYILTTAFIFMYFMILPVNVNIFPVINKLLFKLEKKKRFIKKSVSIFLH